MMRQTDFVQKNYMMILDTVRNAEAKGMMPTIRYISQTTGIRRNCVRNYVNEGIVEGVLCTGRTEPKYGKSETIVYTSF